MGLNQIEVRPPSRLQAVTSLGGEMVAAAERFSAEFAEPALEYDRTATFARDHLDRLGVNGFLTAPIPDKLGGGGVESIHDVLVASARLAEGDPATTIGVNMHFAVTLNIVRAWRAAGARGDERRQNGLAMMLQHVVDRNVVFASAASEPSPQDLNRPRTTAHREGDDWVVDGRKAFATMAPAATIINTAVTYIDKHGAERYAFAHVPRDAPGVEFHNDWDAIGMRASDSGSVSFSGVRLAAGSVRDVVAAGEPSAALLDMYLTSGAFHAAASLGIAESAQRRIVSTLTRRADTVVADAFTMSNLADSVVDLTAMRASLDSAGRRIDEYFAIHTTGESTLADARAITAEVQASKAFICAAAQRVTDRALALTGGAGYMAAHPLAKSWRDARAGAFMHPYGANRAFDFVARAALGLDFRTEAPAV